MIRKKGCYKMKITNHTVEKLKDPTGILLGERYEFILTIEVDDEDELFSEKGIYIKGIYLQDEVNPKIVQYHIYEMESDKYIELSLEEEEEEELLQFCKTNLG